MCHGLFSPCAMEDMKMSTPRSKRIELTAAIGGLVAAVAGVIVSIVLLPASDLQISTLQEDRRALEELTQQQDRLEEVRRDLEKSLLLFQQQTKQTRSQLEGLEALVETQKAPEVSAELARELAIARENVSGVIEKVASLENQGNLLHNRLNRLEQVILDNPEKAVALPLIRRDVESLKQQTSRDFESVRAENARVYDLMKWLVGLMGLVSLSLIGTAVGNVFKRDAPREGAAGKAPNNAQAPEPQGETSFNAVNRNRNEREDPPHNTSLKRTPDGAA